MSKLVGVPFNNRRRTNSHLVLLPMFYVNLKVFDGNTESHTVVSHVLDPPIIARFVRIRPVTWNSHISMRAEFFGCREGEYQLIKENG